MDMKEWSKRFWEENGDRIFYLGIATAFGLGFLAITKYSSLDMSGEGKTILIGVATFCLNRVRGVVKKD